MCVFGGGGAGVLCKTRSREGKKGVSLVCVASRVYCVAKNKKNFLRAVRGRDAVASWLPGTRYPGTVQ